MCTYVRTYAYYLTSTFLFIYFSFIYINLYYILTSYVNNKRVINIYKFYFIFFLYYFSFFFFLFGSFSFINLSFTLSASQVTSNPHPPQSPQILHTHTRTYIHTLSIPSNHPQIDFPNIDIHTQMPCKALFSLIQPLSPLHLYQCPPKEK